MFCSKIIESFVENAEAALLGCTDQSIPEWAKNPHTKATHPHLNSVVATPEEDQCMDGTEITVQVSFIPEVRCERYYMVTLTGKNTDHQVICRDDLGIESIVIEPSKLIDSAIEVIGRRNMGYVMVTIHYTYMQFKNTGWTPVPSEDLKFDYISF